MIKQYCLPIFTGLTLAGAAHASSHMDAPLITFDDPANTTDVYAFKSERNGTPYLFTALSVYPFEQPGIGPNKYSFDDDVLYEIHVALGDDAANGEATLTYEYQFETMFANTSTILQVYLGVIDADFANDADLNLLQSYTVTKVDHRDNSRTVLGSNIPVAPNNQGIATPLYNQGDDGANPAKGGVASEGALDPYTANAVADLANGYRTFAGQREDGFYADIQSIFDLLQLRSGGVTNAYDSQSGFNVHTLALEIPVADLATESGAASTDPEMQVVGVYATTSRQAVKLISEGPNSSAPRNMRGWVQVGRQGNPLFCEALVGLDDKDLYNRTSPSSDASLFEDYALNPELTVLIDFLVFGDAPGGADDGGVPDNRLTNRTDIAGVFIPDLIKVDLSTNPARLQGGNDDDAGFSRLGIFDTSAPDVLTSQVQPGFDVGAGFNGTIPGGWPNGRRFGDDVIDIAVAALVNDLRTAPVTIDITAYDSIDNVSANDSVYNKVFPYAGTPHNGRNFEANPQLVR